MSFTKNWTSCWAGKMSFLRVALVGILSFSAFCAFAQKMERVSAEYTYYAPENVSVEEAKRIALERAQIQAIADAFGTIVSQSNTTFISSQSNGTSSELFSLGGSDVKGEWIETIGEPQYEISYSQNTLVVKVSVAGRIREIATAAIDFKAKVLKNGIEDKFEATDFHSGDDLYLSFLSPVDGYLAVYLIDMEQQAYCLLPYRGQSEGIYRIKANKPYLFFNASNADPAERPVVDEYVMTSSQSHEQNMIYIIFSPNSFAKAADNNVADRLPRVLGYSDFQKWLVRNRKTDSSMNLKKVYITITK